MTHELSNGTTSTSFQDRFIIDWIIAELDAIPEKRWQTDTVRTEHADGTVSNCLFGHIFDLGGGDDIVQVASNRPCPGGGLLWDWFEDRWATTYMLYPVNDGRHPGYQQPTAKQRVLAYLRALEAGTEKSTKILMDEADTTSTIDTSSPDDRVGASL